jgi:hypothetical protein
LSNPTHLVVSGRTRLKSVSDITSEAIIGPAVNSRSPTIHGPMNTQPHSASRTEGRSVHVRSGGVVAGSSSSIVAVIGGRRSLVGMEGSMVQDRSPSRAAGGTAREVPWRRRSA